MAVSTIEKSRTLLWSNPNTGATFAPQTVLSASDISKYKAFEIEVRNYVTGNVYNKVIVDKSSYVWAFDTSVFVANTGAPALCNRAVTIDSNGLSFSGGYSKTMASTSAGISSNNVCIPTKIYGIN